MCITISTVLFGLHTTLQYDIFQIFPNYETSFWFMFWCHRIVMACAQMFLISITDNTGRSCSQVMIVSFFFCINAFLHLSQFTWASKLKNPIFALSYIHWFVFYINLHRKRKINGEKKACYANLVYLNLFFLITVVGVCSRILLKVYIAKFGGKGFIELSPLISIYTYVFVSTIFSVVPLWIAHHDIIITKDEISTLYCS